LFLAGSPKPLARILQKKNFFFAGSPENLAVGSREIIFLWYIHYGIKLSPSKEDT
jgi:hypothetical protein